MSDLVTRLREAAKDMQRGVYNPSQIAAMKMAADALEGLTVKLAARTCPHYIPNRHDRGVDDCCTDFLCEVKYLGRWIPVEERMPEPGLNVLILSTSKPRGLTTWITVGRYCVNRIAPPVRGYWILYDGDAWNWEPTYWMPLPNPPKEDDQS